MQSAVRQLQYTNTIMGAQRCCIICHCPAVSGRSLQLHAADVHPPAFILTDEESKSRRNRIPIGPMMSCTQLIPQSKT